MSRERSLTARLVARVGDLHIDAEIDTGPGTLVVVGANGAGKTSLLLLLLGALPVSWGRVAVGETVLLDTSNSVDVPLEGRRIGYVPQDYGLFPHLTVRGNVSFALRGANGRRDRTERNREVDRLLEELALGSRSDRYPGTLSGGEKQRVALARALAVRPQALLLDEPLAALDVHARVHVRRFLASYLAGLSIPCVLVTHDARDARALGRRIAVVEAGRITQTGTWEELAAQPASPFVGDLLASARDDVASSGA